MIQVAAASEGNGTVVVVHRTRGEHNGKQLDGREALVFRVEGKHLTELTDLSADLDADNDFWA